MATRKQPVAQTPERTTVEVVSFKEWTIIRDLTAYSALLEIGLPLTKIHTDTMPIIRPLLRRANIVLKPKPWVQEFDELMTSLAAFLKNPDAVRSEIGKFWVVLPTQKSCDALQEKLLHWFTMRSFHVDFARRESNGKWTLRGEVIFDKSITPHFIDVGDKDDVAILELDSSNELALYMGKKPVPHFHFRLNAKAGGADEPVFVRDIPFSKLHRTSLLETAAMLIRAAQMSDKN